MIWAEIFFYFFALKKRIRFNRIYFVSEDFPIFYLFRFSFVVISLVVLLRNFQAQRARDLLRAIFYIIILPPYLQTISTGPWQVLPCVRTIPCCCCCTRTIHRELFLQTLRERFKIAGRNITTTTTMSVLLLLLLLHILRNRLRQPFIFFRFSFQPKKRKTKKGVRCCVVWHVTLWCPPFSFIGSLLLFVGLKWPVDGPETHPAPAKKLNKTKNPKNNSKWLKIGWVFLLN